MKNKKLILIVAGLALIGAVLWYRRSQLRSRLPSNFDSLPPDVQAWYINRLNAADAWLASVGGTNPFE